MADNNIPEGFVAYISIQGNVQGNISAGAGTKDAIGNKYMAQHEDECLVYNVFMDLERATDPSTGTVTGPTVQQGLSVIVPKEGNTLPLMVTALNNAEPLTITLTEYRYNPDNGQLEKFMTTKMTDCRVTKIKRLEDNQSYSDDCVQYTFKGRALSVEGAISSKSADVAFGGAIS